MNKANWIKLCTKIEPYVREIKRIYSPLNAEDDLVLFFVPGKDDGSITTIDNGGEGDAYDFTYYGNGKDEAKINGKSYYTKG